FGFVHQGKMMKELSKAQFEEQSKEFIHLKVGDVHHATEVLTKMGITDFKVVHSQEINIYQQNLKINQLVPELVSHQVIIDGIHQEGQNLENFFKELLGNEI